jgi:hypothetical protein
MTPRTKKECKHEIFAAKASLLHSRTLKIIVSLYCRFVQFFLKEMLLSSKEFEPFGIRTVDFSGMFAEIQEFFRDILLKIFSQSFFYADFMPRCDRVFS